MAGVVHIPWYATRFRGDKLAAALNEAAAASIRDGATQYKVHRSRDDPYRLLQMSWFESKLDWERYWNGPDFIAWRGEYSSFYQVPVLYIWHDLVSYGRLEIENGVPS